MTAARDPVSEFADAIRDAGGRLKGSPVMDGEWHRIPVEGDTRSAMSGRYKGYLNGRRPAGFIENFRDETRSGKWKSGAPMRTLSATERQAMQRAIAAETVKRERATEARHAEVAKNSLAQWDTAPPAPDNHPYLVRKGISAAGLRVEEGRLLVPMRDFDGDICAVQTIDADGGKLFPKGGRVTGLHLLLGEVAPGGVLLVAEGFATAATLHAATGHATVVAFSKTNYLPIARTLRERFPGIRIAFCGDNDHHLPRRDPPLPNVGQDAAEAAARECGGVAILPEFEPHERGSDWNDYAAARDHDAVRAIIDATLAPATHANGAHVKPLQQEQPIMSDAPHHADQPGEDDDAGHDDMHGKPHNGAAPNGHDPAAPHAPDDDPKGEAEDSTEAAPKPAPDVEAAADAEAAGRAVVDLAASLDGPAYQIRRTKLAATVSGMTARALDKLRNDKLKDNKRLQAEAEAKAKTDAAAETKADAKRKTDSGEHNATLQETAERAADMSAADYAINKHDLAAGPPKITLNELDALRKAERIKRQDALRAAHDALGDEAAFADDPDAPISAVKWAPGYIMKDDGLHYFVSEESTARICGHFEHFGRARDARSSGWGHVLKWIDGDGVTHRELVPPEHLHGNKGELETRLASGGLYISSDFTHGCKLRDALTGLKTRARVGRVSRCGWHEQATSETGHYFVLPDDTVCGILPHPVILDGASPAMARRSTPAGLLADWQNGVAKYAAGNPLAAFAMSAALAGPLLDIARMPSGGFHFAGGSQIGKTTALKIAASVWGEPEKGAALGDWNSTANALESTMEAACDGLVTLDEIQQGRAQDVEAMIYQMANEGGKARLRADATARDSRFWRTITLSSGEVTPARMLSEIGKTLRPGADIRLASIPLPGSLAEVWPNLHGARSPQAFLAIVRAGMKSAHGTAIRAFLTQIAARRTTGSEAMGPAIVERCRKFADKVLAPNATEQAITVATRFGLVAAAGESAIVMGLLPWPVGEADRAAGAMLKLWLVEHGGADIAEHVNAVDQVRAFIERHAEARFVPIGEPDSIEAVNAAKHPTPNRAGWRVSGTGSDGSAHTCAKYYVQPQVWKDEVCKGLDPSQVARALIKAEHMTGGDGKNLATNTWIPNEKAQRRVYVVLGNILE